MDVVEFLGSLRVARQEIHLCRERIAELEDANTRITTAWKEAPTGSGDVHKDATVIALADKRAELLAMEKEYADQMLAVEQFISRLENTTYRTILELRYVKLLRWPQVQKSMEDAGLWYSFRYVMRLHGKALVAARRLWNTERRNEK